MKNFSRPLLTPHLKIRSAAQSDMATWSALYEDEEARRHLNGPLNRSPEKWWEGQRENLGKVSEALSIVLPESGEIVGVCGLIEWPFDSEWEVWLMLWPKFWRRSYGSQIIKTLVNVAFKELKAARVLGVVDPENCASIRMIEKLGFKYDRPYSGGSDWQKNHQIYALESYA